LRPAKAVETFLGNRVGLAGPNVNVESSLP